MSALFPDVPIAAGVPAVLRRLGGYSAAESAALNARDYRQDASPSWGIFDRSGAPLVQPDSVAALGFTGEHRIADYPVEGGDFQSYNKVRLPFATRLAMTKGGSVGDRTQFLNALEALRASTDLVDVASPETVYVGVNVIRVSYDRSADAGSGLLTVEVMLQEVRQTASIQYSTATAAPEAAGASTEPAAATPAATPSRAVRTAAPVKLAPKPASAAPAVNRGAVQGAAPRNGFAPRLIKSFGHTYYKYDVPVKQ